MCGIIGMNFKPQSFDKFFQSLISMEYRGYDSFGLAGVHKTEILSKRMIGSASDAAFDDFKYLDKCSPLIGHTRWATHGKVSENNAHPHTSKNGSFSIVHNGVIANFSRLKEKNPHWQLYSETDSEVIPNILQDCIEDKNHDILENIQHTYEQLEGEFAIVGIQAGNTDSIFFLKRKSPLHIAHGTSGFVIASDRIAFGEHFDSCPIAIVPDCSVGVLTKNDCTIITKDDLGVWQTAEIKFVETTVSNDHNHKGNFDHYMIKEIFDIPEAASKVNDEVIDSVIDNLCIDINKSDTVITGAGSAFYVSLLGQYFFSEISNKFIPAIPSDEFGNLKSLSRRDLVICVSQSGETFDTLEIARLATHSNSGLASINNVEYSTMQGLAHHPIFQNSGKEICVLSTKSIISQSLIFLKMAIKLGYMNGSTSSQLSNKLSYDIEQFPKTINDIIISIDASIQRVAKQICNIEHWFFIGRGVHYPVSLESALKFKEVSYLHAEGMPAGFFKHGTISLIEEGFYTVVFLPSEILSKDLYQLTIDNVYEIKARGGNVIAFGSSIDKKLREELFFDYIEIPDINPYLNAISQLVAGQMFAYYCAKELDREIDKPRALAKSVTVR